MIEMKRIYEPALPEDGFRILVDRLWPRGISKEKAEINLWAKEITPSTEIRKEFGHKPENFEAFKGQYLSEIARNPAFDPFVKSIKQILDDGSRVTFVYAAKDPKFNHVVILKKAVEKRMDEI
ncbi:MAG: DUF488 domain-containing protein [Christensenellaceae bacterium]